ncbi:MAG: segregation and condensation protein A [Candidatus Omnitrophota bacterium]|jgi:segregation and condensation protein A
MDNQDDYSIRLDVFEGPLDLLLYLIKKDEVDIYDIPIVSITTQYNDYLDMMKMLDLNIAGEFIVMSATLMMIKSRMMLPVDERPEVEEEEDDPRIDLVRQLVEYKKFKDASLHLEYLEVAQQNIFFREGEHVELGAEPERKLVDVSIFDLLSTFTEILQRVQKEELREIFIEKFTVAEKIDYLLSSIKGGNKLSMKGMFVNMNSRTEIVCTFLAILELIRLKHIRVVQEQEYFGDILIIQSDVEEDIIETI